MRCPKPLLSFAWISRALRQVPFPSSLVRLVSTSPSPTCRVSSAHTQRVLTPLTRMHRLVTRHARGQQQSQSRTVVPRVTSGWAEKRTAGPTTESGVRVPGGPAEEATGSSAARSSSAALSSRRGDALASGAIGSPGCAGTERGQGADRSETSAEQSRRVPVAGRPMSCAGGAAAPRRPLPGHAPRPRSATEATRCPQRLLAALGRPLPARSRQDPHEAGGAQVPEPHSVFCEIKTPAPGRVTRKVPSLCLIL